MPMENGYIYTEANISKSIVGEQWETDPAGNPIIIIEASNEDLDYEGERVLRSALLNSKEYFLNNGVISYDHKHLPSADNFNWDPEWNAEKYVLGKPLDAWEGVDDNGKKVVLVKAVLSRSNAIAKEIIGKLKDGIETVKASVGGRKVKKTIKMDTNSYEEVPTILSVDWDEVALTYKPVNQSLNATTLCPKEFVKSLTAGSSANPGDMSGGNALQAQSLEGSPVRALLMKLNKKEITKTYDAITHLENAGYSPEKASAVLKVITEKYLGDIIMEKDNVNDLIDTQTDELEKAIKDLEGGEGTLIKGIDKMKDDGMYKKQGGHMYMKKADGKYEKMDEDSPDYEDDDDDKDDDDMGKSLGEYDVIIDADLIVDMGKSIDELKASNKELIGMVKSITGTMDKQSAVMKSMANVAVADSNLLKSISGTPQPRSTNNNLNVTPRFEKAQADKLSLVTSESLIKSMSDAGVDGKVAAVANFAFRKGGIQAVVQQVPAVAEILVKG